MIFWTFPELKPKKLEMVTTGILKEIPKNAVAWPKARLKHVDFPGLLERIRGTPDHQIDVLAKDLTVAEVDALCYKFREIKAATSTKQKAMSIIKNRWKRRYAQIAWEQYLNYCNDKELTLLAIFGLEGGQVRGLDEKVALLMAEILKTEKPIEQMASNLSGIKTSLEKALKQIRISENTLFAKQLLRKYMLVTEPKHYMKENPLIFVLNAYKFLWAEHPSDYSAVVNKYLSCLDEMQHEDSLMQNIYECLGDPRETITRWDAIDLENRKCFLRWLNLRIMSDFFAEAGDNERFRFWEQFALELDEARSIKIKDNTVAFLVFEEVFVVEFAQVGNAAYVYPRNYYEARFKHFATGKQMVYNESRLKDSTNLFRILHGGNWQSRYYNRVASCVRRGGAI